MLFFPGFAAPESLSKAAGAEPFGGMRPKSARDCRSQNATKHFSIGTLLEVALLKKCTPLWRKADFEVKMYKTHPVRTTCGS
jgi:hypothetical protein